MRGEAENNMVELPVPWTELISDAPVSMRTPKIKWVMGCTYGSFRQGVGKMEECKQVHTKSGHLLKIRVIPAVLPQPSDHRLEVVYAIEMLNKIDPSPITNPKLLIDEAMAHLQYCNDPALESDFYLSVGLYYALVPSDRPTSAKFSEQTLSSARLCEDSTRQANALNEIARLKGYLGDLFAAKRDAHEAQQMAHISGNFSTQASALKTEMTCLAYQGNLTRAVILGHRARELMQLCGLEGGPLDNGIMVNLAYIHMLKSEYQEARNIHVQLQNKSCPQQEYFNAFTQMNIAGIEIMVGAEFRDVQQNLENAKTTFGTLGFTGRVNECEIMLADLSLRDGKASIAEEVLQNYLKDGHNNYKTYCLQRLANVDTWTVIYLAFAHQGKRKLELYKTLGFLGDVFLSQGDEQTVHKLFVVALEGFIADGMLHLGDITKNRGDLIKAVELWKEARPLFERSLQVKDMAQIDTRLASIKENMPGTQPEALVQLTSLEAQLDEVSNVGLKYPHSKFVGRLTLNVQLNDDTVHTVEKNGELLLACECGRASWWGQIMPGFDCELPDSKTNEFLFKNSPGNELVGHLSEQRDQWQFFTSMIWICTKSEADS
ncbi:hypothetical protein C8R44DRAFT_747578 [Mycena epipterygia]|nr:hypothetical protein C8R44DRAFT_747578 [Mycena epipterygia]